MGSVIAACGNDCAACPRYTVYPYEKTNEELHHTAELWMKIGYRDHIVTNEEIACSGCKPENWCRYRVIKCCVDRGIKNCGECDEYPCDNIKECFKVTKSFEPMCRQVCTDDEYKKLEKRNTSKFISLILRHQPEAIGITLDEHGWADVQELIDGINRSEGHILDMELLGEIVRTDEKQRYSFNEDHTLIRANQGHSIPVDVELEEKVPPEILWHGTGEKYVSSIDAQGLIPKSRLYVHLSSDMETAHKVGSRHGKSVIYEVDCHRMTEDGYRFFLSANHVWLTKEVPARYLKKL